MIKQTLNTLKQVPRNFNKRLFVFDFDETVTDDNTDTFIYNALDGGKLPQNVLDKFMNKGQWNNFMKEVFSHMHSVGVTPEKLRETLVQIPIIPGMHEVFNHIKNNGNEAIIISNANTLFVDWVLKHNNLQDHVSHVFTNPAHIDQDGKIILGVAHEHDCDICWFNQCKTKSLTQYVNEQNEKNEGYDKILYFGDGANDVCPIINIGQQDYGFVRKGMALEERIEGYKKDGIYEDKISSQLIYWQDGHDLVNEFKKIGV